MNLLTSKHATTCASILILGVAQSGAAAGKLAANSIVHLQTGRLVSAPEAHRAGVPLQICVRGASEEVLVRVLPSSSSGEGGQEATITKVAACVDLQTGSKYSDGLVRYQLALSTPRANRAPIDRVRLNSALDSAAEAASGLVPGMSPLFQKPVDGVAAAGIDLSPAIGALKALIENLSKAPARPEVGKLAGALVELEALNKEHLKWKALEEVIKAEEGRQIIFQGEFPVGPYRHAVFLDETGETLGPATSSSSHVAPHDQLIFYMQRPGATSHQVEMNSEGKGSFSASGSLPPSQTSADWVVERIGDGTNFAIGKDVKIGISRTIAEKKEKVRDIAIPVLESYRWSVTAGVYFSGLPRRKYYLSDDASRVATVSQTTTTVSPSGTSITTVETTTFRPRVALDQPAGWQPAPGAFLSFYLKPRTTRPGRPIRRENFIPAIVLGAKLDTPLKEGLLGIGFEPIRGLQFVVGYAKGSRPEPAIGVEVGSPLDVPASAVPTVERFADAKPFVALNIDVRPLGDAVQKLLGKLF